jgi:iron only hydrogenase large subunit-like protein
MLKFVHSVKLIEDNCRGCTKCMNKCPMEAIRLKSSKAVVYEDKCIDCGECIRTCPYHAHIADKNTLEDIKKYKIKVAIPSVTLYSQFGDNANPVLINDAIKKLGFDEVADITYACDVAAEVIKKEIEKIEKPVISVFCPSIARLLNTQFPSLLDHIVKVLSPVEIAANLARENYTKLGYKYEDVGIFYLSSCVSWVTILSYPSSNNKSEINGTIAISDIYSYITKELKSNTPVKDMEVDKSIKKQNISFTGLSWAVPGGMSKSMNQKEYIAVDGVNNVIKVFNEIENGKYQNVDFIEAYACSGGCLGGIFLVENPYNARRIIKTLSNKVDFTYGFEELTDEYRRQFVANVRIINAANPKLADDFEGAVKKMKYMNKLINTLPGIDCGLCGSPSCKAFAEDVARGLANVEECKNLKRGDNYDSK